MVISFNNVAAANKLSSSSNTDSLILDGVLIIEPDVFEDSRGFFLETWQKNRYEQGGINAVFVQDNHSRSQKGVIRGLHYQLKNPQAKLVYAVRGTIFDVVVDIRKGSPTFGCWGGGVLSDENRRQLFIPAGFAHGFSVLSEFADVTYKCSNFYTPGDEYGIIYNDPDINIDWHLDNDLYFNNADSDNTLNTAENKKFIYPAAPLVSEKDIIYPKLQDIPNKKLFTYNF